MTFTIDDAIAHEQEMATCGAGSSRRAQEHRQLVYWLEDYKRLKQKERETDDVHLQSCCDLPGEREMV
jgi:hypothetical protein